MSYSFYIYLHDFFLSFVYVASYWKCEGVFSWLFEYLVSLRQSSSMWPGSFWPHNLKHFKSVRMYYSFKVVTNFHFFGNYGFVKCQNVCVYFFITPFNGNPLIVYDSLAFLNLFISSGIARYNSLFLILHLSC